MSPNKKLMMIALRNTQAQKRLYVTDKYHDLILVDLIQKKRFRVPHIKKFNLVMSLIVFETDTSLLIQS